MKTQQTQDEEQFPRQAVRQASGSAAFLRELQDQLQRAEEETAPPPAACKACGRCCDFAAMDHRLLVSTGELALLASQAPPNRPAPLRCPYQIRSRCTARQRRPLGCRLFFCDKSITESMSSNYERFHRQIIRLHHKHSLPYHYAEMTAWLEAVWETEEETWPSSAKNRPNQA